MKKVLLKKKPRRAAPKNPLDDARFVDKAFNAGLRPDPKTKAA